jgi:predicted ribosome quality control (RQC) complex YloA/Tae2 family protein
VLYVLRMCPDCGAGLYTNNLPSELRKSLVDLNTLSNNTTSRLDNTYYNVLEKLSILHSTIASLKELATLTRQLNDDFIKESSEVVQDIEIQLDSFEDFHPQERKIEDLEHRIEAGREKAHMLGDRVDLVKQKIERWEKVESEWQQRTRKRLKFLWAITAIALLLLVGLVAFQYTPARTHGPGALRGFDVSNITVTIPELEDVFENETQSLKRSAIDALEKLRGVPEEELEDDPRLKAFDEL